MNWIEKENFTNKIISIEETRSFIKKIDTDGGFASKRISLADIKYLDPVFIGWLALLAKKYNTKPEIIPPKGDEYFKLLQLVPLLDNLKVIAPQYDLVASIDYSPIFLINSSTYDTLFNRSFASTLENFKNEFQNVRKDFYPKSSAKKHALASLRQILLQLHKNSELETLDTSVLLYYFESLSPIALIRGSIDELFGNTEWTNRPAKLGIAGLEHEADYEKYVIEFLKEKIIPQSPLFIYFFSLYVRNFYTIYNKSPEIKTQKYKKELDSLYAFCMDYYFGIKELTKNIIEHSGENSNEGEGIIVTRIYTKEKSRQYIKELQIQSQADIHWPGKEWKGIFTVYVVDKGKKGIIKTATNKLKELINSPFHHEQIKDKLKQEKKKVDTGEITLKHFYDFYDTKNGFKMFHQQIRSAAGLGLMVFSYLLALNKAFMWVSSPGKNLSEIDRVCFYHKIWHQRKTGGDNSYKEYIVKSKCKKLFPMGTSYLLLLPVPSDLEKLSLKSQRQPLMKHQTPEGSSVFSEILLTNTCQVTSIKDARITSFSDRLVVEWPMGNFEKNIEKIKTEWKSLSEDIDKECPEFKHFNKIIVPKIKYGLDATEIFHTLAMVELVSGTRSIILYDVSPQKIEDFIRILNMYHRANVALWSEDCLTLIIPSDFKLPPLIIGGKTLDRWYSLNQKISRFYNNNYWLSKLDDLKGGM